MNAVATPVKPGRAARRNATITSQPAAPEWRALLDNIKDDLRRVCRSVAEIADTVGASEPEIGVLLDMAVEDTQATINLLTGSQPTKAVTDDAFTMLIKPLALLMGAAAMAMGMDVDIFSDSIIRARKALDECQDNLDGSAIGKLLPEGQTITISEPPEQDSRPVEKYGTAAERLELARAACFEIQKLAEAMQLINDEHGQEEHPITHGIMARIMVLSELVYHGAELGGNPEIVGTLPMHDLRRSFRGAL